MLPRAAQLKSLMTNQENENASTLLDRVLLIEDDSGHALLVKRAIARMAREVSVASTAAEGLRLTHDLKPDLIVTDLNLPDRSSIEHVRTLIEQAPGIPIVVLTASNSLSDAVEAMKLGARDFIVKNFDAHFNEALSLAVSRVHAAMLLEAERKRLQREMQVLRVAIENGKDALAIAGADGQLLYTNRSFRDFVELCGGRSDLLWSVLGDKVVKAERQRDTLRANFSSLPDGAVWSTEISFSAERDMAFDLSLSAIPVTGGAGRRTLVVWVRDISDQKRREKFQRDILSTTTHDLKGPLGAIIISSDMLGEMLKGQGRAADLALRVGSSAHTAVNLIDEFLSARRIQEGNFILKPTEQDLHALISEVLHDYETIAASRGIGLKFEAPAESVPCRVDRLGFSRVIGNLLSNALKFTPRGGSVLVQLSFRDDDARIAVSDTGSGMEPSEVQKIFERFSRLEKHAQTAGSGLGLFVVKSIVTAHGGRIDVTSQVAKGTTFDLIFPLRPPVDGRGELISLDFN